MTHITLPRAVAEQALEALETPIHEHPLGMRQEAITALRAALAQQAEAVEPVEQQAKRVQAISECLAVLRPMVKGKFPHEQALKELVGYTAPPQQAEPVEPVAWMDPASGDVISDARHEAWERDFGLAGKGKAALFTVPLYTAPPQRKPLPNHDQHCVDVPGYGLMAVRLVRAVERAHGIGEGA